MQYQPQYPYATTSQQYGAASCGREEQRRRQHEYSQALAQQVAQREQQKQRERDTSRQDWGGFQQQPSQQFNPGFGASAAVEKGLFDGLGRNDQQRSRASFARGQPQLPYQQSSSHYQPGFQPTQASYGGQGLHPSNVAPVQSQQPPVHAHSFPGDYGPPMGFNPQQSRDPWQQQPVHFQSTPQLRTSQAWHGQDFVESASVPGGNGGFPSPQQEAQQHFQPALPQSEPPPGRNGGRRQRTDIHDGGHVNSDEADRFRRKLQQQQEMQSALERQIEEKRLQKLEAKRRQDEEDRREMERFAEDQRRQCMEQERLKEEKRRKAEIEQHKAEQAAAAVTAADQQARAKHQQRLHAQANQPQQYQPPPQRYEPMSQSPEAFGSAPLSNKQKNPFTNSRAHLFEDPPLQRSPLGGHLAVDSYDSHPNQHASPMRKASQDLYPQGNGGAEPSVDPSELLRQYDDMREELRRQKQLVDQLRHAQAQLQQQQQQLSPVRAADKATPTLTDLEQLRNELREELEYREQLHRQELASLKREQQQQQRVLERSSQASADVFNGRQTLQAAAPSPLQGPPSARQRWQSKTGASSRWKGSMDVSTMSLRGESKFVFFDGRVSEESSPEESSELLSDTQPEAEAIESSLDAHDESVDIQEKEASLDFFVKALPSPTRPRGGSASSHRYSHPPVALASTSRSSGGKWRLESLGTNADDTTDSDEDELDASLSGEQLEALFQRNVRRHEILVGFQAVGSNQTQGGKGPPPAKMAWTELHQQLKGNRQATINLRRQERSSISSTASSSHDKEIEQRELALIASSRWMPSTL
ncbi:hypothetical protein BBJ28_00019868 [Nothophytophthora sp. Chile5]|nr:hypothetical protein BBJ28_00019868 [Nothophytophthora sp. Chile5]